MPIAYTDGKLVEKSALAISPSDFGFARGIALYDLTRAYGGKPFRLDDHIARFLHGAKSFGIEIGLTPAAIAGIARSVAAQNGFAHSAVKFYLTAGESTEARGFGFGGNAGFNPRFMVIEDEVSCLHPDAPKGLEAHQRGISVKTVPFCRDTPDVKSTNYGQAFRALRSPIGGGCDDILFTHHEGYVTEGSTSNFFCVIDGILTTPKRGMLYGVTRKLLLELAPSLGLSVAERDIAPAELPRATEAFMTGSVVEMMPIRSIDGHAYPTTMDGPVFGKLRAALSAAIIA